MSLARKEWQRREVEALIRTYRNYECLWNVKSPEYRDKVKRKNALIALAEIFNTDETEIYRKLHNLRNQFGGELKKSKMRQAKDETYRSKWPYFSLLSFIQKSLESGGTRNPGGVHQSEVSNSENEDSRSLIDNIKIEVVSNPIDEQARPEEEFDDMMKAPSTSQWTERTPDDIDTFALFVANEIRSLSSEFLRKKLKRKIQKCILEVAEEEDF